MNTPYTLASRMRAHANCSLQVVPEFDGVAWIECVDCDVGVFVCEGDKFADFLGQNAHVVFFGDIDDPSDIVVATDDDAHVLISCESDGIFQCPKCGHEFEGNDWPEAASVRDHDMCTSCRGKYYGE